MSPSGHSTDLQVPQRPLTARNLQDFILCPQKYLLSFFTSQAESRRFIGGPAALHRALRSALVQTYQLGGPTQIPESTLLTLFEDNWEGELCADSLQEERLHAEGREMLRAYYQSHQDKANPAIATDLRLEGEIGGYDFVAVADRVDQAEDGTITLLRYKSTRRPPGPAELAQDISAGLLLLLGETHFAPSECQVAIYALRPGRLTVAPIDEPQHRSVRERIISLARRVRQTRQFPTNKGSHCRWCRSQAQCPVWRDAHYRPEEER